MAIESVNPATGERFAQFEPIAPGALEEKVALARRTFTDWRSVTYSQRALRMSMLASKLEADAGKLGRLAVMEMGKPLDQAVAEVKKCASVCRYYAEHGEGFLKSQRIELKEDLGRIQHQPLGVVLAVMPWNFPYWQVMRFAAPAVMAGNVGLLKHASNVPQCAQAIEESFLEAGFPAGVFQNLWLESSRVADLIADDRVAAVTLTGSEAAGRKVAQAAGAALKKTVLELGGSDPFIVTAKADLEAAVQGAVKGRLVNNGQSCIAAKRFIVVEEVADRFEKGFVERMKQVRMGDPLEPGVELGPLATAAIRDELAEQVAQTVRAGATLLLGGNPAPGKGFYYPPTVLSNIPKGSPAYGDELFGPVASIFRARDLNHAIALANESGFGLGSSVWTQDTQEQEQLIRELENGAVFVNAITVSDPALPFGGIKRSGYGRELGELGIREFVNAKTVRIAQGAKGSRQPLTE